MQFSEDAEKGVLCSLLISPKEVTDLCAEHLCPEAFYIPAHRILYDLLLEFRGRPVALLQAIEARNQLEEIGGLEYLTDLYRFVPTGNNAVYYIEIVREMYEGRAETARF